MFLGRFNPTHIFPGDITDISAEIKAMDRKKKGTRDFIPHAQLAEFEAVFEGGLVLHLHSISSPDCEHTINGHSF